MKEKSTNSALESVESIIGKQIIRKDQMSSDISIETAEYTIGRKITINNSSTNKEFEYRLRVESEIIETKKTLRSKKNDFVKEVIQFYGNVSAFSNPDHPVSQVRKLYEDADFALGKGLELLKPENVFVQDYEKLNSQYQTVIKCLEDLRDKEIPNQEAHARIWW